MNEPRTLEKEIETLVKDKFPVAIDFDGTCVTHHYPHIGDEVPNCVKTLKKWASNGVGLILDTMRSGKELVDALKWFQERGIELWGVGQTPTQKLWTKSSKAYAVYSIDDRNLGVPLRHVDGERPFVDWEVIDILYSDMILDKASNFVDAQ